jgi:hypothetical protein
MRIEYLPFPNEKYDCHYARLLEHDVFRDYVMEHDQIMLPIYTVRPNYTVQRFYVHRALSSEDIRDVMIRLSSDAPLEPVDSLLYTCLNHYGFLILMDDLDNAWVLIFNEEKYQHWQKNGIENGLGSHQMI